MYMAPFAVIIQNDIKNYVEPDICVICDKDKLSDRGCEGAPDWIIEIVSPSSRKTDYIIKNTAYSRAGVREYWIVDPRKNAQLSTTMTKMPPRQLSHLTSLCNAVFSRIYP